jgi:hypothetical protein
LSGTADGNDSECMRMSEEGCRWRGGRGAVWAERPGGGEKSVEEEGEETAVGGDDEKRGQRGRGGEVVRDGEVGEVFLACE